MKTRLKSPFALLLSLALVAALTQGCCTTRARCGGSATGAAPKPPALTQLPPPSPAPASQGEKMAWFREAKFGLFIHWGLYCQPAGEWKSKPVPGIGEWIMNRAQIPVR